MGVPRKRAPSCAFEQPDAKASKMAEAEIQKGMCALCGCKVSQVILCFYLLTIDRVLVVE